MALTGIPGGCFAVQGAVVALGNKNEVLPVLAACYEGARLCFSLSFDWG